MSSGHQFRSRIIIWVHRTENAVLTFLFSVLLILAFVQIAGRLFFNIGFSWADPIIYNLVLWVGLIGAAVATREHSHITIDVVTRFLPNRWKHLVFCITDIFSAFICSLLAWAGYRFTLDEADIGTMISGKIPSWIFQLIIPMAFGVMAIRYIIQGIQEGISFGSKEAVN